MSPDDRKSLGSVEDVHRRARIIGALYRIYYAPIAQRGQAPTKSTLIRSIAIYLNTQLDEQEFDAALAELQEFNWDMQQIVDPDAHMLKRLLEEKTQ